jgi:hypothetical protein
VHDIPVVEGVRRNVEHIDRCHDDARAHTQKGETVKERRRGI